MELEARNPEDKSDKDQIMKDYLVRLNSPPSMKNPNNFVKFYTTGPPTSLAADGELLQVNFKLYIFYF